MDTALRAWKCPQGHTWFAPSMDTFMTIKSQGEDTLSLGPVCMECVFKFMREHFPIKEVTNGSK